LSFHDLYQIDDGSDTAPSQEQQKSIFKKDLSIAKKSLAIIALRPAFYLSLNNLFPFQGKYDDNCEKESDKCEWTYSSDELFMFF